MTTTHYNFSLADCMDNDKMNASAYSIWTRTSIDGKAHILNHYSDMAKAIADFDELYPMAAGWDQDIWLFSKATGLMMIRLATDNVGQFRHIVAALGSSVTAS